MNNVEMTDFTALAMSLTSFAYPIRMITRYIYSKLTDRDRELKTEEWLELIFASATFTWLGDVMGYILVQKAEGHGAIPGLSTTYIGSVVTELDENSWFEMNFLLAVIAASFWFKVLMML